MHTLPFVLGGLLLATASDANPPGNDTLGETRTFRVRQTAVLSDIPADAKTVQWWVSIPDDDRHQDVLDFSVVDVPGTWRIERDADRGNRFLYVEIPNPGAPQVQAVVEFTVRRQPVLVQLDPKQSGEITDLHRRMFAEEVRKDAPHMAVTPEIQRLADEACGEDTNPATQARALLAYVAAQADHYSKDPSKPNCGIGDAGVCLEKGGGCCTDLHSLFIALARARGLPARLQMGYRINAKKPDTDYDPGYRCWVEYFVPSYGWIPADVVEADAVDGMGPDRWFTGLTEWRLWLNEGREFHLRPNESAAPVNTMIIGHAVIDGTVARVLPDGDKKAQLTRTIRYTELP
ncbi:MAG TPA: transglutaminase domain-containing protein [Planctomycetota bacterium]|nr:transglutaminase domain-containing protein [Planctomycetota bacterium]